MIAHNRDSQSSSKSASIKRRAAYSFAAGAAAGAAVCGATSDASAAISYSGLQNTPIPQFNSDAIDLNNDTFKDILLKNYVFSGKNYQGAQTYSGQMVGFKPGLQYVSALAGGAPINAGTVNPNVFFASMAYGASNPLAQFNNAPNAFVGLSFLSGGQTYYGWVRVGVNNAAGTFTVKDWAYETTPQTGIAAGAPEPGTLGMLAAGAAGVFALRRKRAQQED